MDHELEIAYQAKRPFTHSTKLNLVIRRPEGITEHRAVESKLGDGTYLRRMKYNDGNLTGIGRYR